MPPIIHVATRKGLFQVTRQAQGWGVTQAEAAFYLQRHFEDGSLRSWITEYWQRGKGKKGAGTKPKSANNIRRKIVPILFRHGLPLQTTISGVRLSAAS